MSGSIWHIKGDVCSLVTSSSTGSWKWLLGRPIDNSLRRGYWTFFVRGGKGLFLEADMTMEENLKHNNTTNTISKVVVR